MKFTLRNIFSKSQFQDLNLTKRAHFLCNIFRSRENSAIFCEFRLNLKMLKLEIFCLKIFRDSLVLALVFITLKIGISRILERDIFQLELIRAAMFYVISTSGFWMKFQIFCVKIFRKQ